jgi:hypothetical protein
MMQRAIRKIGADADKALGIFDVYMELMDDIGATVVQTSAPAAPPPVVKDSGGVSLGEVPSLSISSSLDSSAVSDEPVDELYARMCSDLPGGGQVTINGIGLVEVVTEPWKKVSDGGYAVDSAGFQVKLKADRSITIGKTMYFPGQAFDAREDLRVLLESYAHRNSSDRGPVRSTIPKAVSESDLVRQGVMMGNFAGGLADR